MPPYPKPVSHAQNAAMHAAAAGRSTIGIPESVGEEFAKGAHAAGSLGDIPKRVAPAKKEPKMRKPFGSFAP